jgi:hypothetical protein
MKRPHKIIGKALLVSMLSTGLGWYAGTVASDPAGNGVDQISASSSALLAQGYFNSDKPPYVRNTPTTQQEKKKQLEKSEFSRLEEKPAVAGEKQQPTYRYRYVPGAKPPYERIPCSTVC